MIQNNNDNSYYLRLMTQKTFKINDRSDLNCLRSIGAGNHLPPQMLDQHFDRTNPLPASSARSAAGMQDRSKALIRLFMTVHPRLQEKLKGFENPHLLPCR